MVSTGEQRSHPRRPAALDVVGAAVSERPLPRCSAVDASRSGVLLVFDEPAGLPIGERIVLSLVLDDGKCHLIGTVRRVARGDDFRTYVAVEFFDACDAEISRLDEHLSGRVMPERTDAAEQASRPARPPSDRATGVARGSRRAMGRRAVRSKAEADPVNIES